MKDTKYIDRSMDYFELKYCDNDNLTIESALQMVVHYPLVRFLKTLLDRIEPSTTDTDIALKFLDMLYIYGFINHDELELLRNYKNILSKEKNQC